MGQQMTQIEEMVAAKQYESAIKVINDSLTMDKWKEKYGTQMQIVKAYCQLFDPSVSRVDTAPIRKDLEQLNENEVLDLPAYYQTLAFDLDNKLQELE